MDSTIILCSCSSTEHQIILEYNKEGNLLYCSIHLKRLPFLRRLKYLFGYKCKYGNFEEFIINSENKEKFIKELNKIKDVEYNNTSDGMAYY